MTDSRSAVFSPCRTWRYVLTRQVSPELGHGGVNFILLNPSTADERVDDPTIRRCQGFAYAWGYRSLVVTNLFAIRATDPAVMMSAADPIGPENDEWIRQRAILADRVVIGWGAHGHLLNRGDRVLELLRLVGIRPFCLTKTNGGQPGHPLYLPKDLSAVPFEPGMRAVLAVTEAER